MTFLEFCRALNVGLGLAAALGLGFRLVYGMRHNQLVLPLLFGQFCAAMVLVALGSKAAQAHNSATSPVTACWTGLLISITLTCLFYKTKESSDA